MRFAREGERLVQSHSIPLRDADGTPLSGLPNAPGEGGTGELAVDTAGNPLHMGSSGIDPEGLVALGDGTFWLSDEYGPTLMHFGADGRLIRRLSPFGGACALPAVLARRRPNRGIEGLGGTPDGSILVAALEAPLDNPRDAGRDSRVVRLVRVDTRSGAMRQLIYVLDSPRTVVSDVAMIGPADLLVLESDRRFPGAESKASAVKRVYRVSLDGATDVNDPANGATGLLFGGRTLEQVPADQLQANGVVAVTKTLAVDLLPLGYPHDKAEGLAIIDRSTIAVSNDDDFGIDSDGAGGVTTKILPATGAADFSEVWLVTLGEALW